MWKMSKILMTHVLQPESRWCVASQNLSSFLIILNRPQQISHPKVEENPSKASLRYTWRYVEIYVCIYLYLDIPGCTWIYLDCNLPGYSWDVKTHLLPGTRYDCSEDECLGEEALCVTVCWWLCPGTAHLTHLKRSRHERVVDSELQIKTPHTILKKTFHSCRGHQFSISTG